MFKWMNLPGLKILKTKKRVKVIPTKMMSKTEAEPVKAFVVAFIPGSRVGTGL